MKVAWEKEEEKYTTAKGNKCPHQLSFKVTDSDEPFVKETMLVINISSVKLLKFFSKPMECFFFCGGICNIIGVMGTFGYYYRQLIDDWLSDDSKKSLQFPSCSGLVVGYFNFITLGITLTDRCKIELLPTDSIEKLFTNYCMLGGNAMLI